MEREMITRSDRKNQPSLFHHRLQVFAQAFRKEWGLQEIDAEDWSKLCYYAAHPADDTPDEKEFFLNETPLCPRSA